MKCADCERARMQGTMTYYSWRGTRVTIIACRNHFREIRDALNKAQTNPDFTEQEIETIVDDQLTTLHSFHLGGYSECKIDECPLEHFHELEADEIHARQKMLKILGGAR